MKQYTVDDLFITRWQDLRPARQAQVYAMYLAIKQHESDQVEYGLLLINILRALRRRPLLVDKINERQAVDIFKEIEAVMLSQPWYFFPTLKHLPTPDAELARTTFDQFIYADNEFTGVLAAQQRRADDKTILTLMARLAVTLYTYQFDKENVAAAAAKLGVSHSAELQLVLFTFGHVRERVVKRCKHLLPPGAASEEATTIQPSGQLWHTIKHFAAKTLVFGDFQKLGQSNMYDVLDHLNLLKADAHA